MPWEIYLRAFSFVNIYMNDNQLTIADLASIKVILDTVINRGAIRGNEMTLVGGIYDKLTAFLAVSTAPVPEQPNPQGEPHA